MKITTAQFRVLKLARKTNAENRGLSPPKGSPVVAVFNRLKESGLLRTDEFRGGFWLTPAGCEELAGVEGSKP